jgi:hypothetical protein
MSDKNRIAYYKWELNKYLKELKNELKNVSTNKITEIENKINSIQWFYDIFFEWDESLEWKIRDIEHIIEKNEKEYKNIEEYHSRLLSSENSIKLEIEKLLEDLNWYKEKNIKINDYYKKLFEWDETNEWIVENIRDVQNSIDKYSDKLFEWEESLDSKVNWLILKIEDYEKKYNWIVEFYNELLEWNEESKSIKHKIQDTFNDIKDYKKELLDWIDWGKSIKEKIDLGYKKIKEYYDFIYWIEEERGGEWEILINWKIGYKEKLEKLYNSTDKEYKELKAKIENLLWWATSAGLSSGYKEMKDSFETPTNIWSWVFIVTLWITIWLWHWIDVWNTLGKTILNILPNLPYLLPLIWLAYFSSKQQSQNNRLQQEYAHKESLAKSFEWYKREIDELWEDDKSIEIKKKLMENIVKMTWENPSDTLDKNHWTNPPIWEYLFWWKDKK